MHSHYRFASSSAFWRLLMNKSKKNQDKSRDRDLRRDLERLPVIQYERMDKETLRQVRHLEYWVKRIIVEAEFIRNQYEGKAGIFKADDNVWQFVERKWQVDEVGEGLARQKAEKKLELLELEIGQIKDGKKHGALKHFLTVTPVITSIASLVLSFYTAIFPNKHKPESTERPQLREDHFDQDDLGNYLRDLIRFLPNIEVFMRDVEQAIKARKDPSSIKLAIISFFSDVERGESAAGNMNIVIKDGKLISPSKELIESNIREPRPDQIRERQALEKLIQIFTYIP